MRRPLFLALWAVVAASGFALADPATAGSTGEAALAAAARANQYLFVLFWKEDDDATRSAHRALDAALARRPGMASSVAVRVTDPVERPLVDRYGLSRSPMPLVLAVAPNGAVTAAAPLKLTEQDVARAFVSPGQARCLKAVQARKLILLCVQPTASPDVPEGVRAFQADPRFGPATEVVTLRADDPAEAGFVKALQIDSRTAVPVTALLAPPGRLLGSFPGAVSKQQLVDRVTAPQGGCCPGGKCCPGGCCPGGKCGPGR